MDLATKINGVTITLVTAILAGIMAVMPLMGTPTMDILLKVPTMDILLKVPTMDILIKVPTVDILIKVATDRTTEIAILPLLLTVLEHPLHNGQSTMNPSAENTKTVDIISS
jgi:hypothetical protein